MEQYNLVLGDSFKEFVDKKTVQDSTAFMALRYDFKPGSVDNAQSGVIMREKNSVFLQYDISADGESEKNLLFKGHHQPSKETDCLLIIEDGVARIEKLSGIAQNLKPQRSSLNINPIQPRRAPIERKKKRQKIENAEDTAPALDDR
eukprot:GCRY01005327.1.p1 GENE.GCRY01005327.1~~GCRY01005327.1.p1  ORF type:complete len:147 (+),score=17.19 GCRY01005327.1:258-698(+)